MSLTVVGSIAFDAVETEAGKRDRLLLNGAGSVVADVVQGQQLLIGEAEVGEGRHVRRELRGRRVASGRSGRACEPTR